MEQPKAICPECHGSGVIVRVGDKWMSRYRYFGGRDGWNEFKQCPKGCPIQRLR